jgi:hypothetical protein
MPRRSMLQAGAGVPSAHGARGGTEWSGEGKTYLPVHDAWHGGWC